MKGQCVHVFSRCCGRCEGFQVQWHQAVICTIQHFQCCCVWLGRAVLHAADRKCCTQFIPFFPFLSVRQRVLVTLLVWCEQSLCFLHTEVERKRGKWKRRKKKNTPQQTTKHFASVWLQGVCLFLLRSVSVNQSYCLFICFFSSKMFWFILCWYFLCLFKLC